MALGKEIKVVLSLDDNGFSVKVRKAKGDTQELSGSLSDLSKAADTAESSMGRAGTGAKNFTDSFSALNKSVTATMDTLQKGVLSSFDGMSRGMRDSATAAQRAATEQIDAKKRVLQNEIEVNKRLIDARAKSFNDLRKAQNEANQRALQLNLEKDARMSAYMSAPIGSSLANHANMTADIAALNQQIALHEHNATVIGLEAIKVGEWITAERQANIVRNESVAAMNKERAAALQDVAAKEQLARMNAAVGKSNDGELKRIKEAALARDKAIERERTDAARESGAQVRAFNRQTRDEELENQRAIRQAAIETARIQRQEAQEAARVQREEAQGIAQMWKGLAQAYAGARVMGGLHASVEEADNYERMIERMKAMNIDGEQGQRNTLAIADNVQRQNPNMSKTEALKVTLATTAGAVSTDPAIAGVVAPEIAKFTTAMTRLFPEQAHNIEQFTQNMMGVMEARGIAQDPEKIIAAMDNLSRSLILTQGKITIQDYETLSRRGGMGNAQLKNNESILYDVAAASQLKSMGGGGGGGGGGGVSTYATMQRQAAKAAQGGILEKRSALENLVEFGVIDKDELLAANGNKPLTRNSKPVPYVGAGKAAENMTLFAMELVNKVKAKLAKLPESDTRFFDKGMNRADPKIQAQAFGRFADQSFSNQSRAEYYKMFAQEDAQKRIKAEVGASKVAPTYSKDQEEAMKSWGGATDRFTASMKNLGVTIGTALIPVLQPAVVWVTKLITGLNEFFQTNSTIAALTGISAGFAGISLSVRGFVSMFGRLGLTQMFKSLIGVGAGLGSALTIPFVSAASWLNFKAVISTIGTVFVNLGAMAVGFMSKLPIMANLFAMLARTAGVAGMGLAAVGMAVKNLGMIMLAWDIGYMFGTMISNIEVGSLTVGDHVQNMFIKIETGYKRLMMSTEEWALKARNFLHIDSDSETAAGTAKIKADRAALEQYEKNMLVTDEDVQSRKKYAAEKANENAKKIAADKAKTLAAIKAGQKNLAPTPEDDGANLDTSTVDTKGLLKTPGEHGDRDPLGAALANAEGKVNEQKEKLGAIIAGAETLDSLQRQAAAKIEGKRTADEFTVQHDSKNHPRPDANDPRILQLKQRTMETMLLGEQTKALEFAQQRVAATTGEADAAMQRVADGSGPKQTDAFRALNRELERAQIRLGAGALGFDRWAAAKTRALFEQSRADTGNYTADLHQQNDKSKLDLTDTDQQKVEAEIELTRKTEEQKYEIRKQTQERTYTEARAAAVAAAMSMGPPNKAALENITKIDQENQESRDALDKEMADRRVLRLQEEGRMRETAMQKQVREWKDVNKAVDDIGAKAGNGFVEMLTNSLTDGRMKVGDFVKGVLTDIANAKLKQTLAEPVNQAVSAGSDWVKQNVFGMKQAAADNMAATAATGLATANTAAETSVAGMSTTISMQVLPALEAFASQLATSGATSGAGSSAGGLGGMFGSLFGSGAGGAGASEGGAAIAEVMFANGGIMTSMGALPLRKYAGGGIANRPQVAIHGEAGAEAYVPLPDGRSIPVTMKGGSGQQQAAAPIVSVNVINQTSTPVNAQQNGTRFDGKQMILDVVLSATSQPGPFRAGMKEAMKGG